MQSTVINLPKLFCESIQLFDAPDAQNVREGDINVTQVKLKVKECKWTESSQAENSGHPRTVKITSSNTASSQAVGQVQATTKSENFVQVTLENGIVRGCNRKLKLPLDPKQQKLIEEFGNYVEIDPSKPVSEPHMHKVNIGAALEGPLGASTTATVRNNEKEYSGHFQCKVIMKGKCLASGFQDQIGETIDRLKERRPRDPELAALKVEIINGKKVVVFAMEGELDCKWGFHETLEWK